MIEGLEISGTEALTVVLAAVGMYAAFLAMVRLFGPRVLARMSTFDLVVTLMMGSIAGRVVLGNTPVLAAGILGLGTLLVLEVAVGRTRRARWGQRLFTAPPVAVVVDGVIEPRALRSAHLTRDEVYTALRQAGVRHLDEVALAVFEATGSVSVLRTGTDIDERLIADVHRLHPAREPGSD